MVSPSSGFAEYISYLNTVSAGMENMDQRLQCAPPLVAEGPVVRLTMPEEVSLSPEKFPAKLIAQWEEDRCINPVLRDDIGVFYACGPCTSYHEALEDCLELSHMLGGVEVHGVRCKTMKISFFRAVHNDASVATLMGLWNTFFASHPEGTIIQYFYEEGGKAVRKALRGMSQASRIIPVGINSVHLPRWGHAYRSTGEFWSLFKEKGSSVTTTTLPLSANCQGLISTRFSDPTFISAQINAYLEAVGTIPDDFPEDEIDAPEEILKVLGEQVEETRWKWPSFIQLKREDDTELFDKCCRLISVTRAALANREAWSENRIRSIYDCAVSYLKMMAYLILVAFYFEEQHSGYAIFDIAMILYWSASAVGEITVVCTDRVALHNPIRILAQAPGWIRLPMNFLETVSNFSISLRSSVGTAIHSTVMLLSAATFFKEFLDAYSPSFIKSRLMHFSLYVTHISCPALRNYAKNRVAKVSRSYRTALRNARFFFQMLSLLLVSCVALTIHGFKAILSGQDRTTLMDVLPAIYVGGAFISLLGVLIFSNMRARRHFCN